MSDITHDIADALERYYKWWLSKYDEDVYGIALFSTSLIDYFGCTIFTEEGFRAVVSRYQAMESSDGVSIERLRYELRWSPADSPHHMEDLEIFEPLNNTISGWADRFCELDEPAFTTEVEAAYKLLLDGICAFRGRHLPVSSQVVTTMFWGEMSEEELFAFTEYCNPEDVAGAFIEFWTNQPVLR